MVVVDAHIHRVSTCGNILVVDGVALLVCGKLLFGISISQSRRHAIAPTSLGPYFATPNAIVVQVGIGKIRQAVGSRLEIRSCRSEFVDDDIIVSRGREVVVSLPQFGIRNSS